MHWKALKYPPYSPKLSPCYFYLFGPLKEALAGTHFENDECVESFLCDWLLIQPASFYDEGIKELPIWWEKWVSERGDYVEDVAVPLKLSFNRRYPPWLSGDTIIRLYYTILYDTKKLTTLGQKSERIKLSKSLKLLFITISLINWEHK